MHDLETTDSESAEESAPAVLDRWPNIGRVVADAQWTLLPDETRNERSQARRNNRRLALGLTASGFGAAALAGLCFGSSVGIFVFLVLPLPFIGVFERFRRTTVANDSWIVEQPEENEFLVETLVEVNGVVMGSDRGVAWFEDTAVCFTGQRSWFRVGLDHLEGTPDLDGPLARFAELNPGLTTMRIRDDHARVRIKLLEQRPPNSAGPGRMAIQMAFMQRRRQTLPAAKPCGQTTLPPLTLDPEYRHDIYHNSELWSNNLVLFVLTPLVGLARSTAEGVFGLICLFVVALYIPILRLIRPAAARARAARRVPRDR